MKQLTLDGWYRKIGYEKEANKHLEQIWPLLKPIVRKRIEYVSKRIIDTELTSDKYVRVLMNLDAHCERVKSVFLEPEFFYETILGQFEKPEPTPDIEEVVKNPICDCNKDFRDEIVNLYKDNLELYQKHKIIRDKLNTRAFHMLFHEDFSSIIDNVALLDMVDIELENYSREQSECVIKHTKNSDMCLLATVLAGEYTDQILEICQNNGFDFEAERKIRENTKLYADIISKNPEIRRKEIEGRKHATWAIETFNPERAKRVKKYKERLESRKPKIEYERETLLERLTFTKTERKAIQYLLAKWPNNINLDKNSEQSLYEILGRNRKELKSAIGSCRDILNEKEEYKNITEELTKRFIKIWETKKKIKEVDNTLQHVDDSIAYYGAYLEYLRPVNAVRTSRVYPKEEDKAKPRIVSSKLRQTSLERYESPNIEQK